MEKETKAIELNDEALRQVSGGFTDEDRKPECYANSCVLDPIYDPTDFLCGICSYNSSCGNRK